MPTTQPIQVTTAEAGSKLLRFLERHLPQAGKNNLHKWIRTGQVRINGKRASAYMSLEDGDLVRLPPFAQKLLEAKILESTSQPPSTQGTHLVHIIAQTPEYLIIAKPDGLPVQSGTKHTDSLASRLATLYAGQPIIPAPVHRLDKQTSGLVAAGTTQRSLQRLSHLFATPGGVVKEYYAVVAGRWTQNHPTLLSSVLHKQTGADGKERMASTPPQAFTFDGCSWSQATEQIISLLRLLKGNTQIPAAQASLALLLSNQTLAHLVVQPVPQDKTPNLLARLGQKATVLHIRLLTGKQHQIRVQLASCGFPLMGDKRYHGPNYPRLLLHAGYLSFSEHETYCLPPDWFG